MFRVARIFRAVSPFSIFLMDQKNNPALQGVSIAKRGKILSKMYKELPQKQRADLEKRAKKHPSMNTKKEKKTKRRASANNEFSTFVKENYSKVKALNYKKRFSALSQLYELQKPITLEADLAQFTTAATAAVNAAAPPVSGVVHFTPAAPPKVKSANRSIKKKAGAAKKK